MAAIQPTGAKPSGVEVEEYTPTPRSVFSTCTPVMPTMTPISGGSAQVPPHPLAVKLAGLMSPMSLRDQRYAYYAVRYIMVAALVVSFPVGYAMDSVAVLFGTLTVAALIALVVSVPNWLQQVDENPRWARQTEVDDYYAELSKARAALDQRLAAKAESATATPASP